MNQCIALSFFGDSLRLQKKYERDHEIAALKLAQPDEGDPHAPSNLAKSKEKILSVEKNDQNRTENNIAHGTWLV